LTHFPAAYRANRTAFSAIQAQPHPVVFDDFSHFRQHLATFHLIEIRIFAPHLQMTFHLQP